MPKGVAKPEGPCFDSGERVATPSSRRRVDGVEGDRVKRHHRVVAFLSARARAASNGTIASSAVREGTLLAEDAVATMMKITTSTPSSHGDNVASTA